MFLERVEGIEPSYSAWKAAALPLSYTRMPRHVTRCAGGLNLRAGEVPNWAVPVIARLRSGSSYRHPAVRAIGRQDRVPQCPLTSPIDPRRWRLLDPAFAGRPSGMGDCTERKKMFLFCS